MGPMNTNPDMPTGLSGDELALEPANCLWATWSPLSILGLSLILVVGNTILQGIFYLLTGDGLWVKVKVTALNLSLAVALIGGIFLGKQPLKALLGTVIPINDQAWRTLSLRYGVYFLAVAIVNELVIMPDIEKRLEAFVRLAHAVIVFPGGAGTAGPGPNAKASAARGFAAWPNPSEATI